MHNKAETVSLQASALQRRRFTFKIGYGIKNGGSRHLEMSGMFVSYMLCCKPRCGPPIVVFPLPTSINCPTRGSSKHFARSFSSALVTFWLAYIMFFHRLRSLQRCTRQSSPERSQRRPRLGSKVVELQGQIQGLQMKHVRQHVRRSVTPEKALRM